MKPKIKTKKTSLRMNSLITISQKKALNKIKVNCLILYREVQLVQTK